MKRILLTAIVLLAAANLPLAAQTPSGPVKAQCKGRSKAPRASVRALSKVPDRRARASPRGLPTSREAPDKRRLELLGALAPWPQRPAEGHGASLRWVTVVRAAQTLPALYGHLSQRFQTVGLSAERLLSASIQRSLNCLSSVTSPSSGEFSTCHRIA